MSVLDTLKAATPLRRTETVCLDGALQAAYDAALGDLEDAAKKDANSLAANHTGDVVDKLDAIRDRMAASQVTFTFERIGWTEYLILQSAHPPREGNMGDRFKGFNIETFYPALIRASCISVADGNGDTATEIPEASWVHLLGDSDTKGALNLKQVNNLCQASDSVNDRETSVPPSARSLLGNRDSGASLAQPSPGESPPSGSEDGNPPGSPKSSTTKRATTKAKSTAT